MKSGRMLSTQLNKRKDGPEGNGDRGQDDQPLQKVLEQLTGDDPEFHNQWFVFKNNQTFCGVHVLKRPIRHHWNPDLSVKHVKKLGGNFGNEKSFHSFVSFLNDENGK